MNQLELWHREQGTARRDTGIARIKSRNKDFVDRMRRYAEWYAREHGRVTADDVRRYAERIGVEPTHPNAWGVIFKSGTFEQIGTECSGQRTRNGGIIRVWRVKE